MKTKYLVLETTYGIKSKKTHTYGIGYAEFDHNDPILIESMPDLTQEYEKIEKLVSLCNELELDVIHLADVVEDFISL